MLSFVASVSANAPVSVNVDTNDFILISKLYSAAELNSFSLTLSEATSKMTKKGFKSPCNHHTFAT